MPRRPRIATGGIAYHVLNRRVARLPLFDTDGDYAAFERILEEAIRRTGIHLLSPELLTREVRVVVIGAGGTGSQMLTGLAQLHTAMIALGHPGGLEVTVMDSDQVSEANVGRQMFYPSDVGLPKATVLVNRINMAMGTAWQAETQRMTGNENLRTDLVIGCVDNRMTRKAILDAVSRGGGGYYIVGGVRARPH